MHSLCSSSYLDILYPKWLSCNTLVSINVVTLCRSRLVPGWMTVFGRVNHLGTEPGTQVYFLLNLSHPSVGRHNEYPTKAGGSKQAHHMIQGDHLSGKPGNVREFDSCQGNVRDYTENQGIVREKILSGKSCLKLFIVNYNKQF